MAAPACARVCILLSVRMQESERVGWMDGGGAGGERERELAEDGLLTT